MRNEVFILSLLIDLSPAIARHSLKLARSPELELIQTQMTQKPMLRAEVYARALRASQNRKEDRTRTRTNTNPDDTEANAAGRSVRACVARKSKS